MTKTTKPKRFAHLPDVLLDIVAGAVGIADPDRCELHHAPPRLVALVQVRALRSAAARLLHRPMRNGHQAVLEVERLRDPGDSTAPTPPHVEMRKNREQADQQ